MLDALQNSVYDFIVYYIDVDYSLWVSWLLTPLVITFLLPLMIVVLIYTTSLIFYIYKLHWTTLRTSLRTGDKWQTARRTAAALWDAHGWIWHGYEINGIENIPSDTAALIIYYHGAVPIDIYYFVAKLLAKNRLVHTVADYFLFNIPGFSVIADCLQVIPGTVVSCSSILKEGNLLAISPGGVYEAQFSCNYELMWKKRLGFAKVAIDAKVPIIPMFTENIRQSFISLAANVGHRLFLKLYSISKFPCTPIYGGFPVKLISHIGEPIPYDPDATPEQVQEKVAIAINALIAQHQRIPGSILLSLLDRIPYFRDKHKAKHKSQ